MKKMKRISGGLIKSFTACRSNGDTVPKDGA